MQGAVGLNHFAQVAIDSEAHARVTLVGLDVNVAGAISGCLSEEGVEHANDGRIVAGF